MTEETETEPDLTEQARLAQKEMRDIFIGVVQELEDLRGFVKQQLNVDATPLVVNAWMRGLKVLYVEGVPETDAYREQFFETYSELSCAHLEWLMADRELIEATEDVVYSGDFRSPHLEQVCVEYRKKIHLRSSTEVLIP